MGIVCNVPDYGTQEVTDHAMALMLSLMKGITFHTRELKKDPKGCGAQHSILMENGCLPVYLGGWFRSYWHGGCLAS